MLADDAGRIVSLKGKASEELAEFVASLVSGIFGATLEMGKMLSISELDMVQFESKDSDVIIRAVKPRFLIGIMVKGGTAIGSVRLFLKQAAQELEETLSRLELVPKKVVKVDIKTLEDKLRRIMGA